MIEYFITGTDTGVGKTTVGTVLLSLANHLGLRSLAMKPVETGCQRLPDGSLQPADALALTEASSVRAPLESVCPFRYEPPISPSVAARLANRPIDLATIAAHRDKLRAHRPDLLIIEGAGGLLVPIDDHQTMLDLAASLALPLVIVAADRLGTINHALLTISVARARGLSIAAVILSRPSSVPSGASNADEIARVGQVRVLGCVPHMTDTTHPARLRSAQSLPLHELLSVSRETPPS